MGTECTIAIVALVIGFLGVVAMLRDYKAKFEKKSITLEGNDKQHELRHALNEQRIKSLETEITDLKEIILEKNQYERRK